MWLVLARLVAEDSSLSLRIDEESGQTILSGADELHLDHAIDRLRGEVRDGVNIGAPQVAYRETISRDTFREHIQTDPSIRLFIAVAPLEGLYVEVDFDVPDVPAHMVAAVRAGIASVLESGPAIGFPMAGINVGVVGCEYENAKPDDLASSARRALKAALKDAAPHILEPIMRIEVVIPESCIGDIIGDLNSRRGQIRSTEARGTMQAIDAMVPLASMFGYVNSLRAISRGLGQYVMTFDHYERVPYSVDPDDRFRPAMAMRA